MAGIAGINELFAPCKRRYKTVDLPVRGITVRIQSLTERELSGYESAVVSTSGSGLKRNRLEDATRRLIVLCVVDAEGTRLLSDQHLSQLADWDSADTRTLYADCVQHVGLKAEDVEGLVKNSDKASVCE